MERETFYVSGTRNEKKKSEQQRHQQQYEYFYD